MPGSAAEDISEIDSSLSATDDDRNLTLSEEVADPAGVPPRYEEADMNDHDHKTRIMEPVPAEDEIRITATNWLDEVADDGTMEWTAAESDIDHRERIDSPRVRRLFEVPEDADWEVRELEYDHYRRAG